MARLPGGTLLEGWGRSGPQEWPRGRTPGRQRARQWACAYPGLGRQLLGPRLLGPGQVPLDSSLEAAGAPPGPTAHVTGQRHAGQDRGGDRFPNPQCRGGLSAPPGHPFLLQIGKLRFRQKRAESQWKDLPSQSGEPRRPSIYHWWSGPPLRGQCPPERFSDEPQECPTPHLQHPCLALTGLACRGGLARLRCLYTESPHPL